MSAPSPTELRLARQANVKWRSWTRASDKAIAPYASEEAVARSAELMTKFVAWLREHDSVEDHANGETFSVGDHTFFYTRKGDPRLARSEK